MAPLTARIEVFRPGTFTPMAGEPLTYSAADLKAAADAYDPATAPAPIVVGHPETDAPAFGWVKSFDFDATAGRLFANVGEIDPTFADAVKSGKYRKVSMSFFPPKHGANPVPGTWYPKHVGFLGAAAPAVPGLRNAAFSIPAAEAATFEAEFGARVGKETAGLFRMLRDLLIEEFGLEKADRGLPGYRIEWLDTIEEDPAPGFTAPPAPANPEAKEDPPVTDKTTDFAAREAELNAREAQIAKREKDRSHEEHAAFAENLVQEGRLLPASKDKVVGLLDALPAEATVSFAEDAEKLSPAAALRAILAEQPKVISLGKADLGDGTGQSPAAFAADGATVDPDGLAVHHKALAYQRANPGTAYLDAVAAVS